MKSRRLFWLLTVMVVLCLTIIIASANNSTEEYVFVTKWGSSGSGDGQFSTPYGVAADFSGNVYVQDRGNQRIQKFDSTGTFLKEWHIYFPRCLAVNTSGYVYVGSDIPDTSISKISIFDSQGTQIGYWIFSSHPTGIAIDSSGFVYIAGSSDPTNANFIIRKFTPDGILLKEWGSPGSGDGQFMNGIEGVAVDSSGFVYVTEHNWNYRIQKFDSEGNFITKWGSRGDGDGLFLYPQGIAVDSAGFVYVVDNGGYVIIPPMPGEDPNAPLLHSRIQKFDSEGNFITKWGSYGSGDGQFICPLGIAVNSAGFVYVTEQGNNRIQKFALESSNSQTSATTIINATIQQQLSVAITDPFTGTWTLNPGANSQNYGNLTITANVPWSESTSATNGDYLKSASNTTLTNKLQLNTVNVTAYTTSGTGSSSTALNFAQQVVMSDPAGSYGTVVTFTVNAV